MSQGSWPNGSSDDLADLAGRRDALRQAAAMSGADPRALLDAAFTELDAAVEVLTKLADCTLLGPSGPVAATLTASVLGDDNGLLVVTVTSPPREVQGDGSPGRAISRAGSSLTSSGRTGSDASS
ncbi:MAG: hypothetical protein ACRDOH_22615 [Streptosporangiaceae bacterium]